LFHINKVNGTGNIEEVLNSYTSGGRAEGKSILISKENKIIVCGNTNSLGIGETDALLLKLNLDGSELVTLSFGGNYNDSANHIIQTKDGGYLMVGNSENADGTSDILVIKTDQNGNVN